MTFPSQVRMGISVWGYSTALLCGANNMTFPSQRLVPPGSSTKLGMFRTAEQFPQILPLPTLNHAQKNVGIMLTAVALSTVQRQKTVTVISIRNAILLMGSIRITPSA